MKILSIAYNPYNNNNNSKTMRSFFDGVPAKDMAMLYLESFSEVDYGFCDAYYRITDQDVLKSVLNFSFRTHNSHPSIKPEVAGRDRIMTKASKRKVGLRVFRELLWKLGTWNTKELNDWVEEQKPDIIFTLFGNNLFVHEIVVKVAKRHNIPFVAYYTDDYVLNCFNKSLFGRLHWMLSKKVYKRSMRAAAKCYVIGDKMREDYSKAFGREFGILGNCIDFDKFSDFEPRRIDVKDKVVISFIGGLHLKRWQTICELGEIISEINREKSWQVEVNVYALELEDGVEDAFKNSGVNYMGALNPQGVIDTMRNSDALLHVESFDEVGRVFVKYSISTKISEYLAGKRLVIAYGPHEVASISLFKDNNFGCVLTDLDGRQEKKRKLIEAITHYNDNDYTVQYEYCKQHYDRNKMRKMLLDDMKEVIKNRRQ